MHGPAFELLESKLRPPHGRAGTVPRSQLIDLLEPESDAVPRHIYLRRTRLGQDDAAHSVGRAVTTTVRMGFGRCERQ